MLKDRTEDRTKVRAQPLTIYLPVNQRLLLVCLFLLVLSLIGIDHTISFAKSATTSALAHQPLLLHQERNGEVARHLTSIELALLGDPFFNLVLKDHADVTTLSGIKALLDPDKVNLFVVHELIASHNPASGSRRAVLTYEGETQNEVLNGNIMLSVFFDSAAFSDQPAAIEAWGWDNQRGRYNYYLLDTSGLPMNGGGDLNSPLIWKFRNSSDNADLMSASERAGTCLACHLNGAPIMKELHRPWNNWHSSESSAHYLVNGPDRWPVAQETQFADMLQQAEPLELLVTHSIRRFNTTRLNQSLLRETATDNIATHTAGTQTVVEGKRLLRPLFQTTEFNLISARQKSGLHPFASDPAGPGTLTFPIPTTFFLNVGLIAGGTLANYQGLRQTAAIQPARTFSITLAEYSKLVIETPVHLGGEVGDTNFAWFVPEPSHIDVDMADQLLRRGIITPHFLAAVLAIDLERPLLSSQRAELLQYIPDRFDFMPLPTGTIAVLEPHNPETDHLTSFVISAIDADPAPSAAAIELRALLASENAVTTLSERVRTYIEGVQARLNNPATRSAELERLFAQAIEMRQAILTHETFGNLNEADGLLFAVP